MLSRSEENRKTLAAALGVDEAEASRRLDIKILITAERTNASAVELASDIEQMLSRTVDASCMFSGEKAIKVEIIVGAATPRVGGTQKVWVAGHDDGISISTRRIALSPTQHHRIFGLIAACYACGMAIRLAVGTDLPYRGSDHICVSPTELLGDDVNSIAGICHFGEAVLAGAGAVANGFLYGLQHFRISGRMHIVDPKDVQDGILNRCIWYTNDDIGHGKAQRLHLKAQSKFRLLELIPHQVTVHEFVGNAGSLAIGRLFTTVDSRRTRRSLQSEVPREVFDASTTEMEEFVLHFNRQPSDLACLSCIYKKESGEITHEQHVADVLGVTLTDVQGQFVSIDAASRLVARFPDLQAKEVVGKAYDSLFKARCAEGKLLAATDRQVLAPFCFISTMAGAFLALEAVRRINTNQVAHPFNYWRLGPWSRPMLGLRALRPSVKDCEYCSEPIMRQVANDLWGSRASA